MNDYARVPPSDHDAEQAVLGSMLLSKDAIADVVEANLNGSDYYQPAHETVHDAIVDMFGSGEPVDPVTVAARLGRGGQLDKIGGAEYLHTLSNVVPIPGNASYYAEIVVDKAVLRRLITASARTMADAYSGEGTVQAIVDRAQADVLAVATPRAHSDYHAVGDLLTDTLDEIEAAAGRGSVQGVPTGLAELDDLLGGLRAGQMVVVAARPAMGKSVLGLDMCRAASIKHGLTSLAFSLEMTRQEITKRMIAAEAKVALDKLNGAKSLADPDWTRIAGCMGRIGSAPLYIDDSPNMTMTEIRAKARRLKQAAGLDLIVVDYLQLMTSGKRVESRQVEVSEFSRQLKLLAKELEVPVVALSQLNRGPEQRTNKRPMMSDLRESGAIEQDSDIVILLHRDDVYDKESTRPGEADLIVAKHRNGPTRDVTVAFQGHYSRFVDMAHF